jgi:hypothetical protein
MFPIIQIIQMRITESFQTNHPIKTILVSPQLGMVWARRILLGVLLTLGLAGLRIAIAALLIPNVYHKDFMQEYLMAKAVLSGVDPYLPLPELASTFLGSLPQINLPHPTPHPPPVVLLGFLLGFLPYESASAVWLILELVFISGSIYLLFRIYGQTPSLPQVVLVTTLLLAFRPFIANLAYGQLMTLLLLLLVASWLNLRSGKDLGGGLLIGLTVAFKLVAWPLVIYLLIKGRWKAVLGAALAFIGANFSAGMLMGFEKILYYYLKVSTMVTPLYRAHEGNFSLWTIGYRLFEGTGAPGLSGIAAPPLVSLPALAAPFSLALVAAFLMMSMLFALRCRSFDAAFSLVVCSSFLLSPIFWVVYLILALIPMTFVIRRLISLGFPLRETWVTAGLLVLLLLPREILVNLLWSLPYQEVVGSVAVFPFAASLITLLPTIMIIVIMGVVYRLDKFTSAVDFARAS